MGLALQEVNLACVISTTIVAVGLRPQVCDCSASRHDLRGASRSCLLTPDCGLSKHDLQTSWGWCRGCMRWGRPLGSSFCCSFGQQLQEVEAVDEQLVKLHLVLQVVRTADALGRVYAAAAPRMNLYVVHILSLPRCGRP